VRVFCARMCVRYVIPEQPAAEREFSPAQRWWRFSPSFNVAPGRHVPAVRLHAGESEGVMLRWGLVSAEAKGDVTQAGPSGLALGETDRADWRAAWLNGQRCLLPLCGFYAWRRVPAGYRQPLFVHVPGRSVLLAAGLWERSESDADDVIESCALWLLPPVRVGAGRAPCPVPAILPRAAYEPWLHGTPAEARDLLRQLAPVPLVWRAVSPRINRLEHDDAQLIEAVS